MDRLHWAGQVRGRSWRGLDLDADSGWLRTQKVARVVEDLA